MDVCAPSPESNSSARSAVPLYCGETPLTLPRTPRHAQRGPTPATPQFPDFYPALDQLPARYVSIRPGGTTNSAPRTGRSKSAPYLDLETGGRIAGRCPRVTAIQKGAPCARNRVSKNQQVGRLGRSSENPSVPVRGATPTPTAVYVDRAYSQDKSRRPPHQRNHRTYRSPRPIQQFRPRPRLLDRRTHRRLLPLRETPTIRAVSIPPGVEGKRVTGCGHYNDGSPASQGLRCRRSRVRPGKPLCCCRCDDIKVFRFVMKY